MRDPGSVVQRQVGEHEPVELELREAECWVAGKAHAVVEEEAVRGDFGEVQEVLRDLGLGRGGVVGR